MKFLPIFMSLLVTTGFCFAKKMPAPGPFRLGDVLVRVSATEMTTAEISAYMPETRSLFVVGGEKIMEIVDVADPVNPKVKQAVALPGGASSVTVNGNFVAVSLLANPEWKRGQVQVMRYDGNLQILGTFDVCYQPDMITFTPDGKNLLVACEGSPDAEFREDPAHRLPVADVRPAEIVTVRTRRFGEGFQISSIGELVDDAHEIRSAADDVAHHGGPDETGAAGHDDSVGHDEILYIANGKVIVKVNIA